MVGSANTHIGFFANSGSTHWLGWVWGARLRRDGYPDQWRGTPTDLRHKLSDGANKPQLVSTLDGKVQDLSDVTADKAKEEVKNHKYYDESLLRKDKEN